MYMYVCAHVCEYIVWVGRYMCVCMGVRAYLCFDVCLSVWGGASSVCVSGEDTGEGREKIILCFEDGVNCSLTLFKCSRQCQCPQETSWAVLVQSSSPIILLCSILLCVSPVLTLSYLTYFLVPLWAVSPLRMCAA